MRSRSARWAFGSAACIAISAAAFVIFQTEQRLATLTSSEHAFDVHAREAADALADLRVAQQAYVAAGQGVAFWIPKVVATTDAFTSALTALYQTKIGAETGAALDEAAATIADFQNIDRRASEYMNSGQVLMAADVIFTEGDKSVVAAGRQLDAARQAEQKAADASGASLRRQQAMAAAGAAGFGAFVILLLAPGGVKADNSGEVGFGDLSLSLNSRATPTGLPVQPAVPAPAPPLRSAGMRAAADLATDFGRVRDSDELERLLARSAEMMDAAGLIVWMGNTSGVDLQPMMAHGYAPSMLARMPSVPRTADNAAAAAYRTGTLQIVLSHPGSQNGAIVAPILAADGCVGALSAEIRGGGEGAETVQALAAIVAAHLAGIVAATPAVPAVPAAEAEQRAANQ
jgi:hypothetical protein